MERTRYQRIKEDPVRWRIEQEKEKMKYQRKLEKKSLKKETLRETKQNILKPQNKLKTPKDDGALKGRRRSMRNQITREQEGYVY